MKTELEAFAREVSNVAHGLGNLSFRREVRANPALSGAVNVALLATKAAHSAIEFAHLLAQRGS